ncbi:MAG: hypothetical protein ACR2H9_02055 [Longimicrobiaceae bacterium]
MATLLSDPTLPPNGAPPAPPRVSPPSPPETLADTGLSAGFVADLLLKILYAQGPRTGAQITDAIGLPFLLVDEQLNGLQQRRLVEVRGTSGSGRAKYRFDLTAAGRVRAQEAFLGSQYVGCAPVPLEQCRAQAEAQTIRHFRINRTRIREGFADVILERENRLLKRNGLMMMIGVATMLVITSVMLVMMQAREGRVAEVVQARRFVLRDADGHIRGLMGVHNDGSSRVILQDRDGRERLKMTLLPDGSPGLSFTDREGRSRAVLGLLSDETSTLVFANRSGKTRAVLGLSPDESSTQPFEGARDKLRNAHCPNRLRAISARGTASILREM